MTENLKTAKRVCRLFYYGPAQAGKRENLRIIHQSVPPEQRLTLAGDDPERQIAFQVQHGEGEQWQVLIQSVDSGKERYRVTWSDHDAQDRFELQNLGIPTMPAKKAVPRFESPPKVAGEPSPLS